MKKLFSDPHFNVMDGLDTYIDDYGKPDPIPPEMLRRMTQSALLGLFDTDPAADERASFRERNRARDRSCRWSRPARGGTVRRSPEAADRAAACRNPTR